MGEPWFESQQWQNIPFDIHFQTEFGAIKGPVLVSKGVFSLSAKLNTHFHILARLRKSGVVPYELYTPSWLVPHCVQCDGDESKNPTCRCWRHTGCLSSWNADTGCVSVSRTSALSGLSVGLLFNEIDSETQRVGVSVEVKETQLSRHMQLERRL